MSNRNIQRRDFLKATAGLSAAALVPYHFSNKQAQGATEASKFDKMNIGVIGSGGMANGNMQAASDWMNVVAIADVDQSRREAFAQTHSDGKADTYNDYRKVLEREDVHVVHIATPDHWHTKPVVEAMLAGKDIYCEKPLTLTIDEGKLIRKVQKETGRVVQVGTQQRSTYQLFVKAMALVQEGRLGRIRRLEVSIGGAITSPKIPVAEVPNGFDWDRWLGPAPKVDFRFLANEGNGRDFTNGHHAFRWWYEYSGGKLTDWGAHHVDIAMWALRLNGQTEGPTTIGGRALHPVEFEDGMPIQNDRFNTATQFSIDVSFPGNTEMMIQHTGNGVLIEGDKGRILVNRGRLVGSPVEALADDPLPEDAIQKAYKGLPMEHNARKAHWANFVHCVRTRDEPISDVHSHMDMLNVCHLAGISARLGRDITWDANEEQIVGDDQANSFLTRPYRDGYKIEQ